LRFGFTDKHDGPSLAVDLETLYRLSHFAAARRARVKSLCFIGLFPSSKLLTPKQVKAPKIPVNPAPSDPHERPTYSPTTTDPPAATGVLASHLDMQASISSMTAFGLSPGRTARECGSIVVRARTSPAASPWTIPKRVGSAKPGRNVATSRVKSRLQVERGGAPLASAAKGLLRSTSAVRTELDLI